MDKIRVFTAGQIRTMDPGRPTATAVAVAEGRIVSIGSLESMQPWLKRFDHDIDDTYADRVIMPGLIDPHTHLRMSGTFMGLEYVGPIPCQGPDGLVQGLDDRAAVLDRLAELVNAAEDPTRPIVTWGYDPGTQAGHLDRDMLDQISDTIPIWVLAYAPHIVYANTPMIERIGVTDDTVAHGLGRYPDGRLNGWFIETGAVGLAVAPVAEDVYRPGFGIDALRRQAAVAVRNGVTTTADMIWGLESFEREWDDHHHLSTSGDFPLRVLLVPFHSQLEKKFGDDRLEFLRTMSERNTDELAIHGVKFVNDGSYPSMTLKLNFPGYLDGEEGLTGEVPWEEMVETMWPYWDTGVQIHSHANGDQTIDMTLDTVAALQLRKPRFDHRFTIEHYCISTVAQGRRLAALGALASVNPYFVHYRSLIHSNSGFGPDRSEVTARLGSLERAGAIFTLHSDYNLVIGPMAPLTAAWVAVNRLAADGETVMAPGERISVDRAMRAITTDAAYVLRRDHEVGSLEVGKLADFAVLGDDPYEVDPTTIKDIPVVGTVVGGVPSSVDD